jgi:hypothetical protein
MDAVSLQVMTPKIENWMNCMVVMVTNVYDYCFFKYFHNNMITMDLQSFDIHQLPEIPASSEII